MAWAGPMGLTLLLGLGLLGEEGLQHGDGPDARLLGQGAQQAQLGQPALLELDVGPLHTRHQHRSVSVNDSVWLNTVTECLKLDAPRNTEPEMLACSTPSALTECQAPTSR